MMDPNKRERLLVMAAGLVIGLFLFDRLAVTPLTGVWKNQAEQYSELSDKLNNGRLLISRKDQLRKRRAEMTSRSLTKENAEKVLLDSVNVWAAGSGVKVEAIKPQWIHDKELGSRLQIRISGHGRIDSVARMLYAVELDEQPVRLEQVEVRSRNDSGSELSLELQLSGIILPERES